MEIKNVALVIIDISGYTKFVKLQKMSHLHAEEIIFQLLEAVIDKAEYPLTLNKLEGDAAFMYAVMEEKERVAVARDAARQVEGFLENFRAKAYELSGSRAACQCEACQRIRDLCLKVIMHSGTAAFRKIRQFEELAGEDVILAHRLLKNSISAHEYVLMTEAFYQAAGGVPHGSMEAREETYEDLGRIPVRVFYPVARAPA